MTLQVKICGIKSHAALEAAVLGGAHYIGFVIHPASPRHISPESAAELKAALPRGIKSVAVCVNPSDALLEEITHTLNPDFIQLHGSETPQRTHEVKERFGMGVIKALGIRQGEDLDTVYDYADSADMLLLDARSDNPEVPGGTGHSFDWTLLAGHHFPLPWFLSGGLSEANLINAVHTTGATRVDVSSGVEKSRGIKDPLRIRSFLTAAHTLEIP